MKWGHSGGLQFWRRGHRVLTVAQIKAATPGEKPAKLFDSGGLFILVLPSGVKSWRLKYRFGGKEKQLVFGHFPTISLAEARDLRDAAKKELRDGLDPSAKARAARDRRAGRLPADYTFGDAAARWHALQSAGWKPKHAASVWRILQADAFPILSDRPVALVEPSEIRQVVEAMQERGSIDQAHRMLTRLSRIFQLAIVDGKAVTDPAAPMSAILQPVPQRKYPAILTLEEARSALHQLESEPHWPAVKLASRLLALTASRPGPLRLAESKEFHDLAGSEPRWVIPAEKLKLAKAQSEQANLAFTIPLSSQAVATVEAAIEDARGRPYLFPSAQNGLKPISDNALSVAYRRSPGFQGRHVPHGWRSTFSTIMNERAADLERPGDRAVLDLMLAHKPKGVEAHYNRAAYMNRRRLLAQEWADLLCEGLMEPAKLLDGPRH